MAIVLAGLLGAAPVVASPPEPLDEPRFEVPERRSSGPARLSSSLHDEATGVVTSGDPARRTPSSHRVEVVVEGEDADELARVVAAAGGEVRGAVAGAVKATVPPAALAQ
ncbi:MAG: hypothetical protein ACRDYW_04530, partial [Acidimicrobiales bacterium]